jgi:hypothetical protein
MSYSAKTGRDCDCIASVYCTDCAREIRRADQARHADAGHPLIPVICSTCEPASLKP